jgi:hypothetical protein
MERVAQQLIGGSEVLLTAHLFLEGEEKKGKRKRVSSLLLAESVVRSFMGIIPEWFRE